MKTLGKRIVGLFLCFAIAFGVFATFPSSIGEMSNITADAYTSKTRNEALNWVRSQVGKSIDQDGAYGAQCVDLAKAYYVYLGVGAVSGNGADYTWNSLPSGWSRIQGAQPQPGDILVYTNGYGHVAIYESDWVTYHQNFNGHSYVEKVTSVKYNGFSNPYWGVIRPDFKSEHTHSYSNSVTTQPTCTSKGVRTYKCSCGDSYTESISALGHNYTSSVTTQPTCVTKGVRTYKCTRCSNQYTESIAMVAHKFGSWTVLTNATTTSAGTKYRTCATCSYTEFGEIPKLANGLISFYMDPEVQNINYGDQFQADGWFDVTGSNVELVGIEFSSSNENVATVDAYGVVTGVGTGTAIITCTITDNYGITMSADCTVNVSFSFFQWILYIVFFGWIWM